MTPTKHQKLIADRLKTAMSDKEWRLEDLSSATGIRVSTLGNYRTGLRLMKPWDAKIIASALGIRPSFLLGIEEGQLVATPEEERIIRNWRALPENERHRIASKVEAAAMAYRAGAVPDEQLGHLSARGKRAPERAAKKAI